MAWDGYFEVDGNEVINVDRTEAYAKGQPWFKPVHNNGYLSRMLGHGERYRTPLLDDAPWVDPLYPESMDFYGFYPLSVTGLEDSTRTSTPVESTTAGGVPGALRHATRQVVFSGILVGLTEAAVDYGMRWLKEALTGGACGAKVTETGLGGQMCYLSSEPELDEADGGTAVLGVLDGGYYIDDGTTTDAVDDGGAASTLAWLDEDDGGTAETTGDDSIDGGAAGATGSSAQHGLYAIQADEPLLDGGGSSSLGDMTLDSGGPLTVAPVVTSPTFPFIFDNSAVMDVYPGDCLEPYWRSLRRVEVNSGPTITGKSKITGGARVWTVDFTAVAGVPHEVGSEVPVMVGFLDPQVPIPWAGGIEPDGAALDLDGFIFPEADCVQVVGEPLYDPQWPLAVPPPAPPNVPLGNYAPPANWRRRQFTIPKVYVPSWGEVVPKLQVHARGADLRTLRLRFYADPFMVGDISDDPCSYCGDIVISYVPQDHTLVFDGAEERVYVIAPGGTERSAGSLVFRTDGKPFEWPALSCGFGYVVTLDLPQTQAPPVVDLSLFPRAAA